MNTGNTHDKWIEQLNERERGLVDNCIAYSNNNPSGVPGHNLMMIIAKMAHLLDNHVYSATWLNFQAEEAKRK